MTTFTKEQNEMLKTEATNILKNISEGQSIRDVMAQIYVNNLDEKTISQGQLMADGILQSVERFGADYQEAREDIDRFIQRFQEKVEEDKDCVERCNYWLKLGAAVSAYTITLDRDGADQEKLFRELEELSISDEDATPQKEEELRSQAAEAIRNSGILLGTLVEQAEALEALDNAEKAAALLMDFGNREAEYRAVVSMLAYTKIKNGTFEGVPVDITAAQVTAIVCAEMEQARIMESVANGSLAVDFASSLLYILGAVLLVELALSVAATGIAFALTFLHLVFAIPASLMIAGLVLHLFNKANDAWQKQAKAVGRTVATGIRWVVKGMKAVAGFVTGTAIPSAIHLAVGIWDKLTNLKSRNRQRENELVTQ